MFSNKEQTNTEQGQQSFVLVPQVTLDAIKDDLCELKALIMGKAREQAQARWVESEEARKILGVSQKTWQTYRDTRALPFSQFGRKIYVKQSDLDAFLESHKIAN